jgi:hypothetical protein
MLIILALFLPELRAAPATWQAAAATNPPARSSQFSAPGATINVTWQAGCDTPPAGAVTALDYAAGIWGAFISSTVSIELSACWTATPNCGGIACGDTTAYLRNFSGAPMVDTYYPVSLANALAGQDLDPARPDMSISFDSDADWSFETSTPSPSGMDFVSVALHEMGHGLGFVGHMHESYNVGFCGNDAYAYLYPCPTAYDRLAVDDEGIALLSYLTPDPRELGTRLENDANFGGPNASAANGGVPAKLYTPATWVQGSSFLHLDLDTFQVGENWLMTPAYSPGTAIRHPGPLTLAIFQDLGWLRADDAPNLSVSGLRAVGLGREAAFEAGLDWAGSAGQAITYTWALTDGDVITHTASGLSDTATLSWTVPGFKSIAATASVSAALASATRLVLAFGVAASGPFQGDTNIPYTFNAALSPADTALPVTFTWQATGQDPFSSPPDQNTTDAATFTWTTPGTKTITVTATIDAETTQTVHTIEIEGLVMDEFIFLPLVQRH